MIRIGNADVVELADTHDSKSCERKLMWVQLPPSAPENLVPKNDGAKIASSFSLPVH